MKTACSSDDDQLTSDCEDSDSSNVSSCLSPSCSTRKTVPIYEGCSVASQQFSVALLLIYQKHRLTYSDILQLTQRILPAPSTLPLTHHTLLKEFVQYDEHSVLHRCCGCCTQLLGALDVYSRVECQASNRAALSAWHSLPNFEFERHVQAGSFPGQATPLLYRQIWPGFCTRDVIIIKRSFT